MTAKKNKHAWSKIHSMSALIHVMSRTATMVKSVKLRQEADTSKKANYHAQKHIACPVQIRRQNLHVIHCGSASGARQKRRARQDVVLWLQKRLVTT